MEYPGVTGQRLSYGLRLTPGLVRSPQQEIRGLGPSLSPSFLPDLRHSESLERGLVCPRSGL